jgi:large subunit ribosomal protein L18
MQRKFQNQKEYKRWRRHKRVRNRVVGTPERPRIAVFRSNAQIYAQLIDDTAGITLVSVSSLKIDAPGAAATPKAEAKAEGKKGKKGDAPAEEKVVANGRKIQVAREVGRQLAQAAQAKGLKKAAFDRGGYLFHGRVAALAEGAREAGLDF